MSAPIREELFARFQHYSAHHAELEKAIEAVVQSCVKKHVFMPSGRTIYSVVGNSGDEFIDPDKQFCSCNNYFFRVLGGKAEHCYHLLGYRIALESGRLDIMLFHDDEYEQFLKAIFSDVLNTLEDKEDKERPRRLGLSPR